MESLTSAMIGERGPDGKRHVPSYRSGCYYRREEDCCWVCYFRLIWEGSDPELREANRAVRPGSIVGLELDVPVIDRIRENEPIDYQRGEITDVFSVRDGDSAVVAVELETGEEVALGVRLVG